MRWSPGRLRAVHIALLSVGYWVGLAVVKLGSGILAGLWVSRVPGNHGSISATLSNTTLSVTVLKDGATLWAGSTSLVTLAMWVLGPPLLLALTWRWSREAEAAGALEGGDGAPPLPPPVMPWRVVRNKEERITRTPPDGR